MCAAEFFVSLLAFRQDIPAPSLLTQIALFPTLTAAGFPAISPGRPSRVALLLLLSLVLYVLSLEPVAWLMTCNYVSTDVGHVHAPLIWLANHVETIGDVLTWYEKLWLP